MITEDKAGFIDRLTKMRAQMLTERNELYSPGLTIELNGQDVKPRKIDWLTRQATEISKLIDMLH